MSSCVTFGVEEEFLVVDARSGELVPDSPLLLPRAREHLGDEVTAELNLCQIEVGTPICTTLAEARAHLQRLRREVGESASPMGLALAAAGTHPFSSWRHQKVDTEHARYSRMQDVYQIVARQQVICGCHVHVGIEDPDTAIEVMNRSRPWLAVLLALSANSPFWRGEDTGYASYRLEVWQRWPTSGMPPTLRDRDEFDRLVTDLERIDAIDDATFLYWYVRPSVRFPTLEFRICDVCLDVEDAVVLAGLIRGLAAACHREATEGAPPPAVRREVMTAAVWRAARYGLSSTLVSPTALELRPAQAVVDELFDHIREPLIEQGDHEELLEGVRRILREGNGASRQRAARAGGDLTDVVRSVTESTIPRSGPE
jgi:glutamate---cysteine ligase / carboxylate-amine ligase